MIYTFTFSKYDLFDILLPALETAQDPLRWQAKSFIQANIDEQDAAAKEEAEKAAAAAAAIEAQQPEVVEAPVVDEEEQPAPNVAS